MMDRPLEIVSGDTVVPNAAPNKPADFRHDTACVKRIAMDETNTKCITDNEADHSKMDMIPSVCPLAHVKDNWRYPKSDTFVICRCIKASDAAQKVGIQLKQQGSRYWANCFLHDDKTPSLVFFEDGRFYCFSCHAGGDAVKLYELLYALPPKDAAKRLLSDFRLDELPADGVRPVTSANPLALKETVEYVRERRIDTLLAIKRKALKQISIIEQKADLSEDDRQKIFDLEISVSAADDQIASFESYNPSDLVEWMARGASLYG